MTAVPVALTLHAQPLAICRLDPAESPPAWAFAGPFWSVTRTRDELSIVCSDGAAPANVRASRGLVRFELDGPIPLDQIGILASVAAPLAAAGITVFAIATFDTDHLLVPATRASAAIAALEAAGYRVRTPA